MKYQSKKDETVTAKLVSEEEKYGTVILEYLTGNEIGKTISVTTSTLKRWWRKINDEIVPGIDIDEEKLSEPFPEPKEKKYVPKPQSVIDYENRKQKKYNSELPTFENIVETFGSDCKKVNENSAYIKFNDETTLWRKVSCIDIYASEDSWTKLTEQGLTSKANKDKVRPFAFHIDNAGDYVKVVKALG